MDVDGSAGSKGRLANDHKRTRYINLNCTEMICGEGDITAFDHYKQISPRPYNMKPQTDNQLYPKLQEGSRIPEQLRFSFPDIGSRQWKDALLAWC
jgi:hypothetical protein